MALSAATVWEVRTAGSDSVCGGGFVTGASGTDFSQQDAAQYTGTNLVIDGAINTKVTSATHNFVAADVGNLLRITSGAGFTLGFFQIVSVAANAATLDRSAGTLGSTAGTFAVGGALATAALALGSVVAGNTIYAKGGYTTTSTTANISGGRLDFNVTGTQTNQIRFIGYTTTRTDGGKYTITHGAALAGTTVTLSNNAFNDVRNLALVGNATSGAQALSMTSRGNRVVNLKVSAYTGGGANLVVVDANATLQNFEISGGNTGSAAALRNTANSVVIMDGWIHGNAGRGIQIDGTSMTLVRVISAEHTGANGYGLLTNMTGDLMMVDCAMWNNAAGDYTIFSNGTTTITCVRCVSGGGGAYNWDNISDLNAINLYYCAAKANTTALYPATPNTNVGMVTLTGDPWVDRVNGNFAPNSTAGAGTALKGIAEVLFSLTTTYADIGPAQHQDAGGGAGGTGPNVIVSSGAGSRGGSW